MVLCPSRARVDVPTAGDLANDVAKGAHTQDEMPVLGPLEFSADVLLKEGRLSDIRRPHTCEAPI